MQGSDGFGFQALVAFFGDHGAYPVAAFFGIFSKPLMAAPALYHAVIQIESNLRVPAFREDVGAVKRRIVCGEGADTAGAIP